MLTLAAAGTIAGVAGTGSAITCTVFGMELAAGVETYKVLSQSQLPTSAAAQYTVPASTTAFVKAIILANATGSAVSGIIMFANGTAAGNQISGSFSIPANGWAVLDESGWKVYDSSGDLLVSFGNLFDSTAPANTTPLAASASGSANTAAHRDHAHQSPGGIAAITSNVGSFANTETQIVGATIPANFIQNGTTFRVMIFGSGTTSTSPGSTTFRIRYGSVTLTGTIITSLAVANAASVNTQMFTLEALITFRTNGASGTAIGEIEAYSVTSGLFSNLNNISNTTSTSSVDTTTQKILELTAITGAASSNETIYLATIEVVKP